jgi:hypothetical protein
MRAVELWLAPSERIDSVGTYRKDLSVTFLQRRAKGSHLPSAIRG